MKILHLMAGELSGGAGRGAYWLHRALLDLGVESSLLTNGRDNNGDCSVRAMAASHTQRVTNALRAEFGRMPIYFYRRRQERIFSTGFGGLDFTKLPAYKDANLLHLHWINGFVAMRTLRKVDKPVVWTIRDMWPLTGGCHYAMGCERYEVGCGECPQLGSRRLNDLSRLVVSNKRASLPKQLQLVGISRWVSECAGESSVFSGYPVETISNNVDVRQFFPVDAAIARECLGIPLDKRVVLVGAQRVNDFYKGFDLFMDGMGALGMQDLHVLVFGKATEEDLAGLRVEYTNLGFLADTVSLRLAYAAADVFVAPSRMEAFGKTLAEAMACGTPVVCFDATGPKDIVEHQVTGYKARPFEPADLGAGIEWVLSRNEAEHMRLRESARARAMTLFDSRVIAKQYAELYERLLREAR